MDLDDVERIGFRAFGGTDTIVVDDLTGTGVRTVDVDLAGLGGAGDAQQDILVAGGTNLADRVGVSSAAGEVLVSGLSAAVRVAGSEAAHDVVDVATVGGDDTVTIGVGVSGPESMNVDGGEGSDTVRYRGTDGADTFHAVANGTEASVVEAASSRLDATAVESIVLLGLAGADTITAAGNLAPLTALTFEGGEDEDTLLGGNGAIEGQAGNDRLLFNGNGAPEMIDISANGDRARLTRNVANINLDLDGVEGITVRAAGGTDTITVNDLSGTDIDHTDIDLQAFGGAGDAQADTVVVNGRDRRDVVQVTRLDPQVVVDGLPAQVRIAGSEAARDTLRVQTLGGDDEVTVAPDVGDLIATVVDLGADE